MICIFEDIILSSVFNVLYFSDFRYCIFIVFSDFIFFIKVIYELKTYFGKTSYFRNFIENGLVLILFRRGFVKDDKCIVI